MPAIQLKLADKNDIDTIRQLFYDTIHKVNCKDYSEAQIAAWSLTASVIERWEKAIAEQYFLKAMLGEQLVGFASLCEDGYLDFMYVHHEHQGKGIAKMLLNAIEQQAFVWNLKRIYVHVSLTARPFFLSKGYLIVETYIKHYRGVDFDDCTMEKLLP
jgi:putative acetyltransferase